jgi:hypothetical protein
MRLCGIVSMLSRFLSLFLSVGLLALFRCHMCCVATDQCSEDGAYSTTGELVTKITTAGSPYEISTYSSFHGMTGFLVFGGWGPAVMGLRIGAMVAMPAAIAGRGALARWRLKERNNLALASTRCILRLGSMRRRWSPWIRLIGRQLAIWRDRTSIEVSLLLTRRIVRRMI